MNRRKFLKFLVGGATALASKDLFSKPDNVKLNGAAHGLMGEVKTEGSRLLSVGEIINFNGETMRVISQSYSSNGKLKNTLERYDASVYDFN